MNVKNISIVLIVMALMMPAVLAIENPHFKFTLQSYTPAPAEPGSYITANIQIQNDGDGTTTGAAVEFIDNYPFKVDDEADKKKIIGALGPGEDFLAEYRVRIDNEALEGTSYLKLRYTTDGTNWLEKKIPLTISATTQKTLAIDQVNVIPDVIKPGEQTNVAIKLKNLGVSDLRDVSVKIDLVASVIGSTVVDLPFAPIGSSIEKRISLLKSGGTTDFDFVLRSYPEASAGIYKIPVILSYTDQSGNEYSRTDMMSLIVGGEADLMVQVDSSTLKKAGGKGNVLFSITNKGFDEIKFLTLTMGTGDNYKITSTSDKIYLGNIDSDDYETAEFELEINPNTETVTLPLTIEYKDALNNHYEKTAELTLPLANGGGQQDNSGVIIGVVVVLVIIVGFIIIRKSRKAKH